MKRRLTALACCAALLTALTPGPALADVAPPAQVKSLWETGTNFVSRDCGYSVKVPNQTQSLWLFCDSAWYTGWNTSTHTGTLAGFWFGNTAAVGPYTAGQVPTGLTEIPTPTAAIGQPNSRPPASFMPVPTGLKRPDGTTCDLGTGSGYYPASWITGMAQEPSTVSTTNVLISYYDVCVDNTAADPFTEERFGLAEYNPSTNTIVADTKLYTNLSGLPDAQVLGSPIVSGGYLYLFAEANSNITLVRVTATTAAWRSSANYTTVSSALMPSSIPITFHAADFSGVGKGFAIIEESDLGGGYKVWRSSSLTSGWAVSNTGIVPCSNGTGADLCRAFFGHPELSTTSNLLMSYYNPGDMHVDVVAVPW